MKQPYLVALIALCTACNLPAKDGPHVGDSRPVIPRQTPQKVHLTEQQKTYLDTYCSKRWWSICLLRISGYSLAFDSSLDQLRPIVIKKLKLPATANWNDVVTHEKIAKHFAEWDRATVGQVLCGDKNATWDCIIKTVESLRLRKKAGEIGYKATGGRLFIWVKSAIMPP